MALDDTLLELDPNDNQPPATNAATPDRRNGHPVLDFDDTTDEDSIYTKIVPQQYDGGGIDIHCHFSMTSATADVIKLEVSFERIGLEVQDIDSDNFGTAQNSGDITVPSTSGHRKLATVSFTSAQLPTGLVKGESFRVRIRRVQPSATEATGDLELGEVELREAA